MLTIHRGPLSKILGEAFFYGYVIYRAAASISPVTAIRKVTTSMGLSIKNLRYQATVFGNTANILRGKRSRVTT